MLYILAVLEIVGAFAAFYFMMDFVLYYSEPGHPNLLLAGVMITLSSMVLGIPAACVLIVTIVVRAFKVYFYPPHPAT